MSLYIVKGRFYQFEKFLMVQVAGGAQNNAIRMVAAIQVAKNHLLGKALHGFCATKNRASKWIAIPEVPIEKYMHIFVGSVLHHIYFLEDNLSLPFHFSAIEYGMEEDVG
jgi:hypothetical protein